MKSWNEVDRLHGQYVLTVQAFDAARVEAGEIVAAVNARINRDREADRLRLEELEEIAKGSGAAARMAALERDELSIKRYVPTAAETAAHEEAITRAVEALSELVPLRGEFAEVFKAASEELDTLRKEVIGDQLAELRGRWIDGDQKAFEVLGHE